MSETLFCYCLQIADREFLIEVTRNGLIHWDDYQARRRTRSPAEQHLEIKAFVGDSRARERLNAEIDEFTVSCRLAPELFARFSEAARLLADDRWGVTDEEKLDQFLIPLFWSEVNPHLINPLSSSGPQRPPGSP